MSHMIINENTRKFCEECGKSPAIYSCDICGKILCSNCGTEIENEDTDIENIVGNYCSDCYKLGEDEYFERMQSALDNYYEEKQEILEEWRHGDF